MNIADSLKRAPRWAWVTAGGVTIGAIAVRLYQGRDAEDPSEQASGTGTPGDAYGTIPTTTGPGAGVVVPPIVMPPASNDGLGAAFDLLGSVFTDFSGLLGTVVAGDQNTIAALIGLQANNNEVWRDLIAGAGGAPPPAAVQPPVVTAPVPVAPPAPAPAPSGCPAAYPHHNPDRGAPGPKSCYKNCGHDDCVNGKVRRDHGHCYQDGKRVFVDYQYTGAKC